MQDRESTTCTVLQSGGGQVHMGRAPWQAFASLGGMKADGTMAYSLDVWAGDVGVQRAS